MILLIGLSSLGYAIMSKPDSSSTTSVKYGNLEFVKSNDLWVTTINSGVFYFNNLPGEVANVSISGNYDLNNYSGKTVYFVNINPAVNTLNYLFDGIALRVQEACLVGQNCTKADLPVKNCGENVFVFDVLKNETKVYKNQNCVFLEGNSFEAVDKLIYRFFNIA